MPLAAIRSRFAPLTPRMADAKDISPAAERCVTCGRPAGTPYCPHCGERRAADRVYTLGALAAEVWDRVTPADGRVLRSLWTLVRHPGALTDAYMNGVRQPFLAPLGVFFAVNGAFFAAAGPLHLDVLSKPLATHVRYNFYAGTASAMVRQRVTQQHTTFSAYAQRFDAAVETQSRTLVVAMVPAFAALIALSQVRRRRPAAQHLAFGFRAVAAGKAAVVASGTIVILGLYRAMLFFTAFWAT